MPLLDDPRIRLLDDVVRVKPAMKLVAAYLGGPEKLLDVRIERTPANAFVTQNTVNCAEWDALQKLLTEHENVNREDLYFAAAVPGVHGKLIPPCANCERLMKILGASAYGYESKSRNQ